MNNWPPLTYHQETWVHRDHLASRRSQLLNRGVFRVPTVPRIDSLKIELTPETAQRAAAATLKMARFDQEFSHMAHFPFATVLLRGESATSSQIENLTVNARKLSLASIGAPLGGNAELVARNVAAMKASVDMAQTLTVDSVLAMHKELMQSSQEDAGEFRQEWVWVGGQPPVTAAYVAPYWQDVPSLVDDITVFMQRRDIDPTVQAAIAHAHFETIHPFTDGNGRTGRALVSSILRSRGVTQDVIVPISSGLLHDTETYVSALTAYREGNIEPLVICFADAVDVALANAALLAQDIERVNTDILNSRQRVTSSLRSIARFCCSEPAFTAAMLEQHAAVSKASAYRIVDALVETKILREEQKIRGQKVWSCPAILKALDDFAKRSGKRNYQ